jgi:hypothetical protein
MIDMNSFFRRGRGVGVTQEESRIQGGGTEFLRESLLFLYFKKRWGP